MINLDFNIPSFSVQFILWDYIERNFYSHHFLHTVFSLAKNRLWMFRWVSYNYNVITFLSIKSPLSYFIIIHETVLSL